LAVANEGSDNVSILLGDGLGSFAAAVNFALGDAPQSLAVGDFNGDGKQDLAAANETGGNVSILLNTISQISITNVIVTEGNTGTVDATFTVSLFPASEQTVTVNFTTTNDTARTGTDYVGQAGTLTFDPAETTETVVVKVKGDTTFEGNETFFVTLSGAVNAIIADSQGVGTITDDDSSADDEVDCSSSTLQAAMNNAVAGQTISVTGTCNENVVIRNDSQRITLKGEGTATINGSNPNSPALIVRGKGIVIQGFTITGGSVGIDLNRGSNAFVDGNVIENASGHGIVVGPGAFAGVINNLIRNNLGAGIVVNENSSARIGFSEDSDTAAAGNAIQDNAVGILVTNQSNARIVGNDISSNDGDGVLVIRRSSADISNNAINGNGTDGIRVEDNSVVQLGQDSGSSIFELPNDTSTNNTGFGLSCALGGVADGRQGTLTGTSGATDFDAACIDDLSP
jgi:parallel beta-helix repeat protein